MKRIILFAFLFLLFLSCTKESLKQHLFPEYLPGKYISEIAVDSKGGIWIESSAIDTAVHMPSYSSSIPMRIYLTRISDNSFEVWDDRFMGAKAMAFDKSDRLWFITGNRLMYLENDKYNEVFKGADENGYYEWMAIDSKSEIMAGGWNVPLLKVTTVSGIKVDNLTGTSSSAYSTAGCFDRNDNLWIVMSGYSVGKMDNHGGWTIYTPDNSALPYQYSWCITADSANNIWAGTGFTDNRICLLKFDGAKWESVVPQDGNGTAVYGTVRKLFSENNKIWVVSEFTKNGMFDSNLLLTFDGKTWKKISDVPTDDGISDISFDMTEKKAWIGTWNKGCFIVDLE